MTDKELVKEVFDFIEPLEFTLENLQKVMAQASVDGFCPTSLIINPMEYGHLVLGHEFGKYLVFPMVITSTQGHPIEDKVVHISKLSRTGYEHIRIFGLRVIIESKLTKHWRVE